VPDGGHVELAQAAEDVPREHQDDQVDGGQHAHQPPAAGERDHDGRDHHVGRAHVGQVPARRRELARVHPVGDDALADQRPDHVPGQAGQRGPGVAERPVGAEDGQRDQHRPDHQITGRDERGCQQRQHRLVLQVGHVGADPGDQPGLGGRVEQAVDQVGDHEAAQVGAGERVAGGDEDAGITYLVR
jgi:hypothetical protein